MERPEPDVDLADVVELVKVPLALDAGSGHLPTFLGTATARFGAALAVLGFVLPTFGTASLTDLRADPADFIGELRATAHKGRRYPADLRTVAVQTNTFRHHLNVFFAQTRVRAVLACLSTLHTGFDTRGKFFVTHLTVPLQSVWKRFFIQSSAESVGGFPVQFSCLTGAVPAKNCRVEPIVYGGFRTAIQCCRDKRRYGASLPESKRRGRCQR